MIRQLFFTAFFLLFFTTHSQDFRWAKNGKCEGYSWGKAVASEKNGNYVFAETFIGSTEFNGTLYTAISQGRDFIIIMTDSLGNIRWVNHFGSDENYQGDDVTALRFDKNGDILATGTFSDKDIYLNGVFLETRDYSDFIMKIRKTGEFEWIRHTNATLMGLDVDQDNNIFIMGYFAIISFYGNDTLYGADQGTAYDLCVYKLEPDGDLIWRNHAGTPPGLYAHNNFVVGYDVAVNSNNEAVVAGIFRPGNSSNLFINFDNIVLSAADGENSGFIATLDSEGAFIHVEDGLEEIKEVEIDPADDIIIAGKYIKTMDNNFVNVDEVDYGSYIYLMKLTPDYNLSWFTRSYSESGEIRDMDIDGEGNPNLCLNFTNQLIVGDTLLSASGTVTSIYRYLANGTFAYAPRVYGSEDWESHIACGTGKNVAYTGRLFSTGVFGDYVVSLEDGGSQYFISLMITKDPSSPGSSIHEETKQYGTYVWPNPSPGLFYCEPVPFATVKVMNLAGEEIPVRLKKFDNILQVEMIDPVPGIYLVSINNKYTRSCAKIVIR